MKGLLGRKVGMTQVFSEDGLLIPVTVIEVQPNVVLQKKTLQSDGYSAVQLGVEDKKSNRAIKPEVGHAQKANANVKRFVAEIRGEGMFDYEVGQEVKADVFTAGDMIDVVGTSKGKGYTGAVVRNNQALGPRSHGSGFHRGLGSMATGGRTPGRIFKGSVMAGQHGGFTTTNRNLEVIKTDAEKNYILIKGNVPGPKRGFVIMKTTTKRIKSRPATTLVDLTAAKEE